MAAPTLVSLVADTWTLVASNVTDVSIKTAATGPRFYVIDQIDNGGGGAPADVRSIQFPESGLFSIESSAAKDVYVKAVGAEGSVIVWADVLLTNG